MKKILLISVLLFLIVVASAIEIDNQIDEELIFKGINEDNVFTALISNKADIAGGEAIFALDNPFTELDLNKTLFFDWYIAEGKNYNSYEFYVGEIVEEEIEVPSYKIVNYTCNTTDNITHEIIENICSKFVVDEIDTIKTEHLVWTKKNIIPKGEHMIKFVATWDAHLGPQKTDWYPEMHFDMDEFKLPDYISFRKSIWAWWNTSWDYNKEYTNLTGNITYMYFNKSINDNADFNDTRFVSCYDDSLVFNHTLEAKIGTYAQFRINNLGENCTLRYYGNSEATSTSNASDVYFNPVSAYYLDANANDFVGSNDGSVTGATIATGYINGSYDFDGTDDYIDITDLTSSTTLTVGMWVKYTSTSGAFLVINHNSGSIGGIALALAGGDGTIKILNPLVAWSTTGVDLNDGNWHFLTLVKNADNYKLYSDGNTVPDSDFTSPGGLDGNDFFIGKDTEGRMANGSIDEVIIYDKALNQEQIYKLYTQTAPNFIEGNETSEAETTAPTYSNNQTNSTIVGQSTKFSIQYDDDTALHPNGQYIFSTNNTGTWTNESAVNFTATPNWANVTKVLNSTEGISIGYRWYADDNAGNINNTEIFSLTTTAADTCTYTTGNWNVNCNDNCTITSNVNLGGNDLIFSNAGTFWLSANITNYNNLNLSSGCSIIFDDGGYLIS